MKSFNYVIQDEIGIHARPAGLLAKLVKNYESVVTLEVGGKKVEAKKLMAVMGLGVKQNDSVTVAAEGADEDAAIAELEKFFKENL